MLAAKQQGLTIAEYEDRTNANRVIFVTRVNGSSTVSPLPLARGTDEFAWSHGASAGVSAQSLGKTRVLHSDWWLNRKLRIIDKAGQGRYPRKIWDLRTTSLILSLARKSATPRCF